LAVFQISKAVENGQTIEPSISFLPGVISHPAPFRTSAMPRSPQHEALIRSVEKIHPWQKSDAGILERVTYWLYGHGTLMKSTYVHSANNAKKQSENLGWQVRKQNFCGLGFWNNFKFEALNCKKGEKEGQIILNTANDARSLVIWFIRHILPIFSLHIWKWIGKMSKEDQFLTAHSYFVYFVGIVLSSVALIISKSA
jgi:hypothetical protein